MRDDPEKDVTFRDVSAEIEERFKKLHILQFRARTVEKKYCFSEENVPKVSEYMEIFYPVSAITLWFVKIVLIGFLIRLICFPGHVACIARGLSRKYIFSCIWNTIFNAGELFVEE